MFKILGGDGKEYGPVTVEQIKQWVHEGRANHETMAQPSGGIGWKPLAQYAEFADLFGTPPPAAPAATVDAPAQGEPAPTQPAPAGGLPAMVATVAPVTGGRGRAEQLVRGPAIGLIVTAALGMAAMAISIVFNLAGVSFGPPPANMTPEMARVMHMFAGGVGVAANLFGIAVGIFIIYGAIKMQQLTQYGIGLAASILAMVPCFSPCCLLGLPIGIWALVVLSQPEVRTHFAQRVAS